MIWTARHSKWALAALALGVGLCLSCSDGGDAAAGPPGQGVYVPEVWVEARRVEGHQVHVVREQVACAKCHAMSDDELGSVTPQRCAACHQKEARLRHAANMAEKRFGPGVKTDCTTCHAFTQQGSGHPAWTPDAGVTTRGCYECHQSEQGQTPAVKIHGTSECLKCHQPHRDDKPKPGLCSECHGDVQTSHAASRKDVVKVCTTCHQHQHAPAAEARDTCAACHAKQQPIVPTSALFASGHRECVGCHRPHQFAPAAAVSCKSCHEDLAVLAANRVKPHQQCNSCHAPHAVMAAPEKACAKCHSDKHPHHPTKGVAGTCVGCHDPHPPSAQIHARVRDCKSCHQEAASDKEFHAGTSCRQCHVPHQFVVKLSDRRVCSSCHGKQLALVSTRSGHAACEGCHGGLPHRPAKLQKDCSSCHQSQKSQVASGHSECRNCHEPHGGALVKACKDCHSKQAASAPTGHQACQKCHQPHSGSSAKAACAGCHAAEAKTKHGNITGGCTNCHRAHGPGGVAKPPACSSCHQPGGLPGLHKTGQHQACNRCHDGHGSAEGASRSTCLSCHATRKDHFPDASRCTSCHLFTPTR